MTIERTVDELGRTTDTIHLDEEEKKALSSAHSIVEERSEAEGVAFSAEDKEYHGWMFLGILRYEGVDALLSFARNAEIKKPKASQRAYC